MGKQISLTVTSSGSVFSINTDNIIEIVDNGAGTDVTYVKTIGQGTGNNKIAVDESVSAIVTAADGFLHAFYTTAVPETINAWITYGTAVGDFTVGETVVIGNNTRAIVQEDTGTVLKVVSLSNGLITATNTITGVTSGATGIVTNTTTPATNNTAAADKYTYSNGVNTRYLNVNKLLSVTPYNIGALNIMSYDYQGSTYEQIACLETITIINGYINAGTSDVELASANAFTNTTQSTSSTTGSNTFAGGVGIAKNLFVGGVFGGKANVLTSSGNTTITEAMSGATLLFDAAAVAFTLPAITASNIGMYYDFVTTVASTSAQSVTAGAADLMTGGITLYDDTAAYNSATRDLVNVKPTGTFLVCSMNGTTTGGKIGTRLRFTAISATAWFVEGYAFGSGVLATPFS